MAGLGARFRRRRQKRGVYIAKPDGRVLRISPRAGSYYQPCIHPDGGEVVFWGVRLLMPRVWKYDVASGGLDVLSPLGMFGTEPSYGLSGKTIVFTSTPVLDVLNPLRASASNIVRTDLAGMGLEHVTTGLARNRRPAIDPSDRYVAFVSQSTSVGELWIADTKSGESPRKLPIEVAAHRPWFSADGRSIYFFTREETHRLACFDLMLEEWGYVEVGLVGHVHGPSVSPDGRCLLFHSLVDGEWGIYEFDLEERTLLSISPAGTVGAAHPTRARDGTLCFDMNDPVCSDP